MPTSSMSGVRKHFWHVVRRLCRRRLAAGEVRLERVHARADEQRRGVVARDQRTRTGWRRWSRASKKRWYRSRISSEVTQAVYGRAAHAPSARRASPASTAVTDMNAQPDGERVDRVGGRRRPDDRHPRGEPERGADLAEHRLDADPGRELVGPQRGGRGRGEGRQHQPDAGAGEDLPRQDRGQVGGLRRRVGDEPQAAGREHEAADRAERGGLAAVGEAAGGERGGRREQRAGRERDAGLEDRVVPHLGEEEDVAEQQAGEAGGEQQRREPGERERRHPQERELDDRRRDGARSGAGRRRRGPPRPRRRRAPARPSPSAGPG